MFDLKSVRSIQLEITNHCNAACPQCPRNFFGGRTIPNLPLVQWRWKEFCNIVNQLPLSTAQQVYFCGTYGDPMTHRSIADMVDWLRTINPALEIGIHTNGGTGSIETWSRLADSVDFVAFGIDGLEDTNHIYRRHVSWNKVMRNAKIFIKSGGTAYWDFIVFRHNQHQVKTAKSFSEDLGFKQFAIKRTGRFLNRAHQYRQDLAVYNNDGNIDYWINQPDIPEFVNPEYQRVEWVRDKSQLASTKIHCNAMRISEIYIGADGFVFPCGWLHDRLYGPEINDHSDHMRLLSLMDQVGGMRGSNIFHTPLETIVYRWFNIIKDSWQNGDRLERCAVMCGDGINLIGAQNHDVDYRD